MKRSTIQRINTRLANKELTTQQATQQARAGYVRAAKAKLAGKGIQENTFVTITVKIARPLTEKGYVVATVTENNNPYSDPGMFLNSRITETTHTIKKASLLS